MTSDERQSAWPKVMVLPGQMFCIEDDRKMDKATYLRLLSEKQEFFASLGLTPETRVRIQVIYSAMEYDMFYGTFSQLASFVQDKPLVAVEVWLHPWIFPKHKVGAPLPEDLGVPRYERGDLV